MESAPKSQGLSLRFDCVRVEGSISSRKDSAPILQDIDFQIEPGEFVCVLGPSGAGKSTLVRTLLGEHRVASGKILIDGKDLASSNESLRGRIGYVPQADINPPELTVRSALGYAAEIRLPEALTDQARNLAVNEALTELGLVEVADRPIRLLSGGEAKRASLAAELLSNPGLLILDEATSSLDPATEARIMGLLREQSRLGTSILAITHHLDNVDRADKLLIIGNGQVVFFGTSNEALAHFGVKRLSDIYIEIEDKPVGYWRGKWTESHLYSSVLSSSAATSDSGKSDSRTNESSVVLESVSSQGLNLEKVTRPTSENGVAPVSFAKQFSALFRRGMESMLRDRASVRLALFLPVALAALVLVSFSATSFRGPLMITRYLDPPEKDVLADVWGEVRDAIDAERMPQNSSIASQIRVFLDSQPKLLAHLREPSTERVIRDALTDSVPIAPEKEVIDPAGTYKVISLMSIIMMILGFVVGYKEIVKERAMFELERIHGLRCIPYVLAKVLNLAMTLAVQVAIFTVCVEIGFHLRAALGGEVPMDSYRRGAPLEFVFNWLSALSCAAIGLIVSALVNATDKGVMNIPLLITPQVLLSATILPIRGGVLKWVAMVFSPLYWAHRGCRSEGDGVPSFWRNLGEYNPSIWIPILALILQLCVATILTIAILHYQDKRKSR